MFAVNRKPGEIRRVVTGFDSKGMWIIQSDSVMEPQSVAPGGNAASTTIWTTDTFPTPVLDSTDGATRSIQGMGIRSPNGTILKFHEMLSGATPMHITKSVDYAVVLEGEIELHLDDGSCTILRQGDVVIQRGTYHRWLKVADGKAVKMLVCLIDGGKFPPDGRVDTQPKRSLRYLEKGWLSKMKSSRIRNLVVESSALQ